MPQTVADESHGEAHLPSEMPVSSRRDRTRREERRATERQNQPETDFAKVEVENVREKRPRQGPQADSQRGLSRVTHHLSRG